MSMSVMALREVVVALLTQCYDDLIKPPLDWEKFYLDVS